MVDKKKINIITSLPYLGFYFIKSLNSEHLIDLVVIQVDKSFTFKKAIVLLINLIPFLHSLVFYKIKIREYSLIENLFKYRSLNRLCRDNGIKLIYTGNINKDSIVLKYISDSDALINCVLGGRILSKKILNSTKAKWINGHGGVLPEYGGLCSEYWALSKKEFDKVGYTVHELNSQLDSGLHLFTGYTRTRYLEFLFMCTQRNHYNLVNGYIDFVKEYIPNIEVNKIIYESKIYKCPKLYTLKQFKVVRYGN